MKFHRFITVAAMLPALCLISCSGNKAPQFGESLPRVETPASIQQAVEAVLAEDAKDKSVKFESIMILKHGNVVFEDWYGGAAADKPHAMHSVSKSFTATAVGMAVDEGLLKVTDKLVDFFPDQLPEEVSDNLKAVTVHDLLTMNCGHETECQRGDDWVESFLAHPVTKTPGTWYCYNSMGTYMLSAIVTKLTGEKIVDYLDSRLFQPLHIQKPQWQESPQGINAGGWGMFITTEDMAKFGQLFLQKGEWDGKQLVSQEWVAEASKYQVPSVPAGSRPDNVAEKGLTPENCTFMLGYGYQMWMCPEGAYRADGARGQYIMVYPDADAVIAVTADSANLQAEQDLIYKYLFPAVKGLK
ncbi:MAG: beta-lactamase family protein [Bacteroidales bacterium]|nr:beta-lactamase family protein [Bacteroidales bacterium]